MSSVLVPPLNFAMVSKNLYRSGYPNKRNFQFLKKLQLKSIVYLCPDDYSEDNELFLKENGIAFFHLKIKGNKVGFRPISSLRIKIIDNKTLIGTF